MLNRRECAEVAANWWASFIRKPEDGQYNTGIEGMTGAHCESFATMLAECAAEEVTDEMIETFKEKLTELILLQIEEYGYSETRVDYNPDALIQTAADEAGISADIFPWKSCARISREGVVSVKSGNMAPYEQLYSVAE